MLSALLGQPKEGFSMYRSDILDITAWPKSNPSMIPLPPRSALVCVIDISVEAILDCVEALFFIRRGDTDELWSGVGEELPAHGVGRVGAPVTSYLPPDPLGYGRVVTRRAVGDAVASSAEMVEALVWSRLGHSWPTGIIRSGLIDTALFDSLIAKVKSTIERNQEEARKQQSQIVRRAKWLGLNPRPTGVDPRHWSARCPETSHRLYLNTETNEFGCGYCRRRGGSDELNEFARERRERARENWRRSERR
jgi:hypothetical protein